MDGRLLIGGELVAGARRLDVVNPATGAPFDTCARADRAQLDAAVRAAQRAQPSWAAVDHDERRRMLHALADAVERCDQALATTLTREQGKPLSEAYFEVHGAAAAMRAIAMQDVGTELLHEAPGERIVRHREPLGVIAAIVPWNLPLLILATKLAPALLTGNTLVVKPAPTTPLTTLMLAELAADILPAGVFNTVVDANDLGDALTSHPGVAKVSFTGSTATGRQVMASASGSLKRLALELGGNDAAVVFDDVDVASVAQRIFQGATLNAGQLCIAIKRVYVAERIHDDLCGELARLARAAVVGDGLLSGTTMGPVQNRQQFERLQAYLDDARENGTVLAGGHVLDGPGYFVAPTVVRDMGDRTALVREEQFGPILPVLRFTDSDDVMRRVNDSGFGLAASVWTRDIERGIAFARRLEVGTAWVNRHLEMPLHIPLEGTKESGFGSDAVHDCTQSRILNVAL